MNDMGKQLTYQELLAAYNKLLKENEFLHKEVDRLQALLSNKDIPMEQQTIKQHLSLEEKVDVFRNLFKGREDVSARGVEVITLMSARGVEVITLIKSNFEKEERLREIGVSIKINDALAIDVAIFDKSLIWYGSVNYLGYNTDENNAIRIYDSALAENILEVLYT